MTKTLKKWILECSPNFSEDFQCNKILSQNRFNVLIMINCDVETQPNPTIFQGIIKGLIITYTMDQTMSNNFHINNSYRKALKMR
jgi:hypothetical protein